MAGELKSERISNPRKYKGGWSDLDSTTLVVWPYGCLTGGHGSDMVNLNEVIAKAHRSHFVLIEAAGLDQFVNHKGYKRMKQVIMAKIASIEASVYAPDTDWPAQAYQPNVPALPDNLTPLFRPLPPYEFWTGNGRTANDLKAIANQIVEHNKAQRRKELYRVTLIELDRLLGETTPHGI